MRTWRRSANEAQATEWQAGSAKIRKPLPICRKHKKGSIMSKKTAAKPANVSQTITHLLEISKLDSLYRDLYFQRAQELMDTLLPRSTYEGIKQRLGSIDAVERQLRAAVERGDWERSRTLTESIRNTREAAAASAEGMKLGEHVYDGVADIPIDPFSSGLNVFVGATARKLAEWQDLAIKTLATLERDDSSYSRKGFYGRRGADLQTLTVTAPAEQKEEQKKPGAAELQHEALTALDAGDLTHLDEVVRKLMAGTFSQEAKEESA